jgi:hypothetical protein
LGMADPTARPGSGGAVWTNERADTLLVCE